VVGRHAKGDGGKADLAFGANESLGDRPLAQQERARYLRGGQTAEEYRWKLFRERGEE
jgi:hypothetical protein